MTLMRILFAGVATIAAGTASHAQTMSEPGPDELAFSTENMDMSADPAVDFYRYASGGWLDRVARPERLASYGVFDIMRDQVKQQMIAVLKEAGANAANAEKGTPAQQIGDFYNAYMDVETRDSAGTEPIADILAEIQAIETHDDLTRFAARMAFIDGPLILGGFGPFTDLADSTKYAMYASAGNYAISDDFKEILSDPPESERLTAYRTFMAESLEVAGYAPEEAARIAALTLEMEIELHAAEMTPAQRANPVNLYNPVTREEMQAQIPEMDLTVYFDESGYPLGDRIILTEPGYFPVLSAMLKARPMQDFRDYATLQTITAYQSLLTTAFDEPQRKLQEAMIGISILPPREERAVAVIREKMGQPLGQLYVENFFSEDTRETARDMIERIQAVFFERMPTRDWLTDATRDEALAKLDAMTFAIGYPDVWIDYSSVEIGSDLVQNVQNIAAFTEGRLKAKFGGPVEHDPFNGASTVPMAVNAAYDFTINGFEVPAAILQSPAFPVEMDAPVYFCRLGAVIGHEMTHGFDSGGRRADANGNLRDWWTAEDAVAFDAEAQKLIDQANAVEILPGLTVNGPLNVGENMADVGGITFAYQALQNYLEEHPEENVEIDGLTPDQRCFLSWAQMWTGKSTDPFTRMIVAVDPHPPVAYRTTAPLQHLDAFYEAFGIAEGDPMWLPPAQRVHAW